MTTTRVQDVEPFAGHSPAQERPLGGYATLMGVFGLAVGGFAAWLRRSGRELPDRVPPGDLALMTLATHKTARLISKDRVTSTVRAPFTRFEGDAGPGEVSEKDKHFYEGKLAATRFFATQVLPMLTSERAIVEHTDNALMEVDEAAF